MNPAASAPTPRRVLTALKVLAVAIKLLVLPVGLSADYSFRQISVVTSAGEPGALAGILVAAGLALLAAVLWRRQRVAFVWLGLSLLTYGVVSNLCIPIGTIFAERLLYLPSVGFCALVVMALARPSGRWRRVAAAVLLVGWGALTVQRNPVWHDQLGFAEALAADAPDSSHAHHVLDGKGPSDRVDAEGYRWSRLGENIASGGEWTLEGVVKTWMDSPHHRENLFDPHWTEQGIALVVARDFKGDKNVAIWVSEFGAR